ncbi:copper homeostasis CutC domain-containing protein [Fusarium venenatum]|uniref:copper homeostasis CutC domain-containing protein n=1 Tax=Fusarium venenatum TaxID=56646 RepID=UPI001DD9D795|nr:copper homeostasis CutC domain-containing protein [Fusarium venenatum]
MTSLRPLKMSTQLAESPQPMPLEVTVYGPYNALKAANFGAKRLLLCRKDSSYVGGLTPEIEELEYLRDNIHIPISCAIRPRGAPDIFLVGESQDYIYSNDEFIEVCDSILNLKETGVMNLLRGDSFVFGCLKRYYEGTTEGLKKKIVLDRYQCGYLVNIAKPFGCIFNRAFDHFAKGGDWSNIIPQLIKIGFTGVMTTGGPGKFNRHIELLGAMGQQFRDIQLIVAGGFHCPEIKKLRAYANEYDTNTVWVNGECLRPERHEDSETCDMSSVMGMMDLLGLQTTD